MRAHSLSHLSSAVLVSVSDAPGTQLGASAPTVRGAAGPPASASSECVCSPACAGPKGAACSAPTSGSPPASSDAHLGVTQGLPGVLAEAGEAGGSPESGLPAPAVLTTTASAMRPLVAESAVVCPTSLGLDRAADVRRLPC